MNKVAEFKKVSFGQFLEAYKKDESLSVDDCKEVYDTIQLPTRATYGSAGHDIYIPMTVSLEPLESVMIPTGIRCEMQEDYVMMIFPRSSMGIKHGMVIMNTIPVIDSDYYYSDNEGHIFIAIKNTSNKQVQIKQGDRFVQAVFVPFGVADYGVQVKRNGGIGSTNEFHKSK